MSIDPIHSALTKYAGTIQYIWRSPGRIEILMEMGEDDLVALVMDIVDNKYQIKYWIGDEIGFTDIGHPVTIGQLESAIDDYMSRLQLVKL